MSSLSLISTLIRVQPSHGTTYKATPHTWDRTKKWKSGEKPGISRTEWVHTAVCTRDLHSNFLVLHLGLISVTLHIMAPSSWSHWLLVPTVREKSLAGAGSESSGKPKSRGNGDKLKKPHNLESFWWCPGWLANLGTTPHCFKILYAVSEVCYLNDRYLPSSLVATRPCIWMLTLKNKNSRRDWFR